MQTDYVQRFLFEELCIRGRLVCLTGAWRRMLEGRGYAERIAALLGHATALAVLLGAGQKGAGRVALQVQGSGPVKLLVAECTSQMKIRGMAMAEDRAGSLLAEGRLAVTLEDTASGQLYQSVVPLEGETMSEVFESYLRRSEQIPAFLQFDADADALFGLLLEKLPGASGWDRITRLAGTLSLAETRDAQPYDLLTRLFPEELLRVFRLYPVEYHCPDDAASVKAVLRGLGRAELESILAEHGEVVIRNEMCNHEYRFDARAVAEIFGEPVH